MFMTYLGKEARLERLANGQIEVKVIHIRGDVRRVPGPVHNNKLHTWIYALLAFVQDT